MFSNYSITNEELGAKVKAAHQKHIEHVEAMRPVWEKEGQEFRAVREDLKVSRSELSQHIGISDQVIAKFEKGQSVRSRNMLKQSYQTSLKLIQHERNNSVQSINNK
ncbi:MAG: helix-turn-helix transcriptional regulator [Selenomonadaceae bacterium]|nr:helix-turn-helix transcriptional regulator [Selenomonadaceae bacterium]